MEVPGVSKIGEILFKEAILITQPHKKDIILKDAIFQVLNEVIRFSHLVQDVLLAQNFAPI